YNKNEQPCKKAYCGNFRNPELAMVPNGGGHDQKIDIHVVPYQYHNPGGYHKPRYPFIVTVHKYQYGKYKVKYQHSKKQEIIFLDPHHKIGYLFGDIGVPDQHKLPEPDVGPKNTKSEHI